VPFVGDDDGRKVGFHYRVDGGGLELWAAVRFGMPGGFVDETRRGVVRRVAREVVVSWLQGIEGWWRRGDQSGWRTGGARP